MLARPIIVFSRRVKLAPYPKKADEKRGAEVEVGIRGARVKPCQEEEWRHDQDIGRKYQENYDVPEIWDQIEKKINNPKLKLVLGIHLSIE